ncbi:hypothetical protein [uncultured Ruminococcus sp.]|uniref:hypothetical protein n=1 Tax=uncultured Ruminococcus sp. TaxID=165186 RepID=UPI00261E551A|nr:hypothetical protein [uncultured Ruminococcus sp.]
MLQHPICVRMNEFCGWVVFRKAAVKRLTAGSKKKESSCFFVLWDIVILLLMYFIGRHVIGENTVMQRIWLGMIFVFLIASVLMDYMIYRSRTSGSKNWYMITERQLFIWRSATRQIIADQLVELTDITVTMGENHIGRIDYRINGKIVYDKVRGSLVAGKQDEFWVKWQLYAPKCNFHNLCGIENPEEVAAILGRAIREAKRNSKYDS